MKKGKHIPVAVMLMLAILAGTAGAQDCELWLGTWEATYEDESTRTWKVYEATEDTGSSIVLCQAFGASEYDETQVLFQILYITFTGTYSYTEDTELSSTMQSTEMELNESADAFTVWPDGQYPLVSGIKTNDEVPDEPDITTTTTVSSTTTTAPEEPRACAVSYAVDNREQHMLLRAVRDIRRADPAGAVLADMYYRHSSDIIGILKKQPALKRVLRDLVSRIIPVAEAILAGEEPVLADTTRQRAIRFLERLKQDAGPQLQNDVDFIIASLREGTLLK
ncbi:hypothetical protein ACFL43_03380 [Thermodesulfobacteriota bacterium]